MEFKRYRQKTRVVSIPFNGIMSPFAFLILSMILALMGIVILIGSYLEGNIIWLFVALPCLIPIMVYIIFPRWCFTLFIIDVKGVAYSFRKKEFRRIYWEEISDIYTQIGNIYFEGATGSKTLSLDLCASKDKVFEVLAFYESKFPNITIRHLTLGGKEKVEQ